MNFGYAGDLNTLVAAPLPLLIILNFLIWIWVSIWASEASPTLGCSIKISRDICDRFWENPYKRGKYHYSISSVLVISLIFVKIFFIMKMDVWNIVLGPGKDIRSGTHYNSRSKPNTVLKFLTSRAASIRKTGTRP